MKSRYLFIFLFEIDSWYLGLGIWALVSGGVYSSSHFNPVFAYLRYAPPTYTILYTYLEVVIPS